LTLNNVVNVVNQQEVNTYADFRESVILLYSWLATSSFENNSRERK